MKVGTAAAAGALLPKNEGVRTAIVVVVVLLVIVVVIMILSRVFGGIDKVLEGIGLKDSAEKKERERQIKEAAKEAATNESPFSPNFYKTAPSGTALVTRAKAESVANQIWDSVGIFYDDSDQALAAFKQLPTQAAVSFVADVFNDLHQRDLFKWLENKFDTKEQQESLNAIVQYVYSLPKYFL